MTKWIGPAAWGRREVKAGDRLPFGSHIDAHTIRLRDGALMQMIQVPGLPFETEDALALDHHLVVRETMLRSVLDARFIVYHHIIRRRVRVALEGEPETAFASLLQQRWQERLDRRELFINEQVLTIVRRPARGKSGWPDRLRRRLSGRVDMVEDADIRALTAAATALETALEPYGARQLGLYDGLCGRCSEPLEVLSALYNGETRPVLLPSEEVDLGHHLPYARVSFGLDTIETRRPDGRSFSAILSVKDYPDTTRAGIIDHLLRLPSELVLTESFAPADRQSAREKIDLALRRLRSADEEAGAERREMLEARDALGMGQVGFGDHHLSVLVRSDDLDALETACARAGAALADIGAIAVREDVNLEPCFWGQFPGNESYLARKTLISSANAAGFLSLHGMASGRANGNHWGPAVTVFETTSSTPYFFNFHEGDLGNFTVIGPSGSGKTVILNFLVAQAQKFAPRTIFFDKDRGAEIFLRASGGHYARLVPGQPTGFNPLALEDNPVNRGFVRDWLAVLLRVERHDELATIAAAVDACFDGDPAFRRLRYFGELLGGTQRPEAGDLASLLAPWIKDAEHAWIFDNAVDALDMSAHTLGFDMTSLLDSPALRTPVMMYLFHRIEERLDGEPTLVLIDEGWKALDDPVFAARLRDWLKTLRKRNALVGFATQSARDALDSRIASAIVEQTATMIFTPNPKARVEDYCQGFGLSEHEFELIRQLPIHSRCFLVRQANHSVVVRLDLAGQPDLLTILSGREASVRHLDLLRSTVGDTPYDWYEPLTGHPWLAERDEPNAGYAEAAE
jgi:type IV secretion system protein VirB4